MHYLSTHDNVRRFLIRGLASGLLFAQLAINLSAQDAAAQTSTDANKDKDKVFVLDAYKVTGSFASSLEAAAKRRKIPAPSSKLSLPRISASCPTSALLMP